MRIPIEAAHESRCGICDSLIYPGDPILSVAGEWCHEDCAREEEE